jgi:dynein heavy chain
MVVGPEETEAQQGRSRRKGRGNTGGATGKGGEITVDSIFQDVWEQVRSLLAPDIDPDEEEDAAQRQVIPQLYQAWRALGTHLLQEISQGRSINMAPIGIFHSAPAMDTMSGTQTQLQFSTKFLLEKNIKLQDLSRIQGSPGPTTRVKSESVADLLGWPKSQMDTVLSVIMKEVSARLGSSARVTIELPGIGSIMSTGGLIKFEPFDMVKAREPKKAMVTTVSSGMFGQEVGKMLRRSASASMNQIVPRLDSRTPASGSGSGRSASEEESMASLSGRASPFVKDGSATGGMGKSASSPALARPGSGAQKLLRPASGNASNSGNRADFKAETSPLPDLILPQSLMVGTGRRSPPLFGTSAPKSISGAQLTRGLPGSDQLFPPLLDRCSRTHAALFREDVDCDLVSNMVASNYSVNAATLTIDLQAMDASSAGAGAVRWKKSRMMREKPPSTDDRADDTRAVDWTAEWPQILDESPVQEELIQAGMSRQEFCRILSRYKYYTSQGVPSDMIAPYNRQWLEHSVFLLDLDNEARWTDISEDHQCQVVDEVRVEILKGYIKAAKTSIVDYALLNKRCRERLDIQFVPDLMPTWGSEPFTVPDIGTFGGPPQEWREGNRNSRQSLLSVFVQNSQTALKLKDFWETSCAEIRLLALPAKHKDPKEIGGFHTQQVRQLDEAIRKLTEAFNQSIIKIVQEEPAYLAGATRAGGKKGESGGGLPGSTALETETRFFDAVAALLSQMAREVVEATLTDYVNFFKRFEAQPLTYMEVKALKNMETWQDEFLINKLQVNPKGNDIQLRQGIDFVTSKLIQPYTECTLSLRDFSRPDTRLRDVVSGRTTLWEVKEAEVHIKEGYTKIEDIIKMNLTNAERTLELYEPFLHLLDEDTRVTAFSEDLSKTRQDYSAYITKLRKTIEDLEATCPLQIRMQMMRVDAKEVNNVLIDCAEKCIQRLLKILSNRNQDRSTRLVKQFQHLDQRIMRIPSNEDQLTELENAVESAHNVEFPRLLAEYEDIKSWLFLTWDIDHLLENDDYKSIANSAEWKNYLTQIGERSADLKDDRARIESKLVERRTKFQDEMTGLVNKISKFKDKGSTRMVEDNIEQINEHKKQLAQFEATMEDIHAKEEQIGWEATEFEAFTEAQTSLEPYDKLWNCVSDCTKGMQKWTRNPLFSGDIDPVQVETEVSNMWRIAFKLKAQFEQDKHPKPATVAAKVKTDLDNFKENVPLLHALCNPGLRERHWKEISNIVGFSLEPDPSFTLQKMLDMDVGNYATEIGEVSDSAGKEFQIESGLSAQVSEWEPINIELKEWSTTETYIVGGGSVDEVQTLLDDHVIKTQTMKGSPFAVNFAEKIEEWENFLKTVQDIIDIWLKVQSVWLYLEPIFSSDDIMQQMPTEGKLFREVDATWRAIMERCLQASAALVLFKAPGFLDELTEAHNKLEQVQKGLNDYLETKRLYFPRFFFLSNDNLLEILSETKDPRRVNAHVKKAFEGIQSLRFSDDLKITHLVSPQKEEVPLLNKVDTVAARGAVEVWLVQLENAMLESLRHECLASRDDYATKSFCDWVQLWCGQACIAVFNLYWTQEVADALTNAGNAGLGSYADRLVDLLADIVNLVRTEIPRLVRCTLEALIVIFVHNKDTVIELFHKGIADHLDFDWMVQLRYFVEENPEIAGQDDIFVRITNSHLGYAYESLGNDSRLVITPLTDRCYRTCCGALHLMYGAAPEGPAGTGKTETVKDLAKALARFCVVFNCSDELDALAMAKFFKGLVSSGGWACFDEFNRIDAEVLSVVAQQILQIQNAIKARLTVMEFEGTTLGVVWTANCFITMNPGYAGRAELPDNLKALFRTVAMMVPDYAMIAEIKLYAYGYEDSRSLAQKIVITYKLCSEQLSSQKHYDYGMRAVFSVLVAAGNSKRKYPTEDEAVLMLRSICEVNLAKFLAFDVPLFKGITEDLFPGTVLPAPDYTLLVDKLAYHLQQDCCQPHPYFMEKIIQFYECHVVRHSVMLVGMPFSGKTTALMALQKTLSDLATEGTLHDGCIVHQSRLNPKSIPASCLYGAFDEVSHEWTDGIVAVLFREMGRNHSEERKWLVFDGPIDAVWIENMNTVMDENKKLCLNSGEIIAMSPNMRTIMEPMDVLEASPATVSRNGMVYFEPELMGFQHLLDRSFHESMLEGGFPPEMTPEERAEAVNMTNWLLGPCLSFIKENCQDMSPCQPQNIVQSFLKILLSHLKQAMTLQAYGKTTPPVGDEQTLKKNMVVMTDAMVVFSIIWSVGAVLATASRPKFSDFIRRLCKGQEEGITNFKKLSPEIPERGSIFDHMFHLERCSWCPWVDTVDMQMIPNGSQPDSIIVQTMDNIRYRYVLNHSIANRIELLFCGLTGTGKTAYMQQVLNNLDKDGFMSINIGFSAQSKCGQTQDLIDAKLDRRRKGIFGPPMGKLCMIMVDDLNMPTKETYGAQPPIEILRMMVDKRAYPQYGGWYDRKDVTHPFRQLIDCLLFACMGDPGGGKTFITPRMLGHMWLVAFPLLDDDNMVKIYSTILDWKLETDSYPSDVAGLSKKFVAATLDIYKSSLEHMLPTPLKVHYTFNLRDFGKIIFGMLLMKKQEHEGPQRAVRLWIHECQRVIGDRLVDDSDRMWMLENLRRITKGTFGMGFDEIMKHCDLDGDGKVTTLDEARQLIFGDMLSQPAAPNRPYKECPDIEELQKTVEGSLEQYNLMSTKKMNLVCFLYMLEHLSRVARVAKTPGGNGLLVGVGGSGRQSCTRLASFLADFDVFSIEITRGYGSNEFREDVKKLLTTAGGKGEKNVFLFSDTQIKSESFVEDLNNLLNSGEVPNLFPADEKVQVCEMVRTAARQSGAAPEGTPTQLYAFFVSRCQKMLSVVLCFSPIGSAWRTRLRQFPSLVGCCTIDWFTAWPQDALTSVAEVSCAEIEFDDEKTRSGCVEMCSVFHSETGKLAVRFKNEMKRIYYTTPTSFLELISTFKTLLGAKRKQVRDLIDKYEKGLEKILTTEQSVAGMKEELIALQPKLVQKNKEVGEMMVIVNAESEKTAKVKEVVAADEAVAAESAAKSEAQKADVEADLDEAMPALQEALSALDTLTAKDIGEIKAMKSPPAPVKLVLQGVCYLKGVKPARVKNEEGKMVEDYWPMSVKMIGESTFLKQLQDFDKDSIPAPVIKKLQTLVPLDDFQPARVKTVSVACFGICMWVRAMETYDRVAKVVAPKKEALAIAMAEYAEVMEKLNGKRAELQKVLDELGALEAKLNGLKAEQDDLAYQVDLCEKKLVRAEQLIESLGGEKVRWGENAVALGQDFVNLTGDVIVASGLIAYLGAFTPDFREGAVKEWSLMSQEKGIPGSETFSLQTCLGEPVKIRNWTIWGLPNDAFSIENGIIIDKSRRWPLCIDPQGQANKWIKKMELPNKIKVKKFTDGDYLRQLEGAIQFGNPFLIENILEETDPAIEPVLLKQTFKQGNRVMMKLGDSTLEYSKEFKFYLTTKLRNPHYLPEVAVKVTVLNFMITMVGLQDQLLNIVVQKERPELAEEKARLVVEGAENKKQLEETENKILHVLQTSQGNILEDESAINVLSASKTIANKIEEKQAIAEATEKEIDEARLGYVPVAFVASVLFFCIADLANIDPMYQYSLPFFVSLFVASIEKAEKSDDLDTRIEILNDVFKYTLYCNICRSLFEKHKTLFSFILCIRVLLAQDEAEQSDYRFLLTGGVSLEDPPPKPADWVPERCWGELFRLSKIHERYAGFHEKFFEQIDMWKKIYDDVDPMKLLKANRPKCMDGLDELQDIMVIRCIRPDRVVPAILDFITIKMGEKFVTPPPFDLTGSYADSTNLSPLIFVLSPGADPFTALNKFAGEKEKEINGISLGQGQGPKAEKLMDVATQNGTWVLLQNCHLATTWMPKLDRILEEMDPKKVHREFRLWLTSYPSNKFPVAILQNGVKMTNEAPKGLRANLTGSYFMDPISNQEFFDGCAIDEYFKLFCYSLCFFHAVIQERRLFGPLGWNIAYEFTENDLRISARQLSMFLEEYPQEVPLKALNYLMGQCNYGGRVTDDKDQRLLSTLLESYFRTEVMESGHVIFRNEADKYDYVYPSYAGKDVPAHELHLEHIKNLPLVTPPGVFGFHENANLTKEMGETYRMMSELLLTVGQGGSGGGSSAEDVVGEIANDVLARMAKPWSVEKVQEKYPTDYEESMNTVLVQELTRFNGLIKIIISSLKDIQKAVKGLLLMSAELEDAFNEMFNGATPALWLKKSYPSLKPLGAYVNDLVERLKFFQNWVDTKIPVNFWFSGIYFTQAFTTGASQNYARKYKIPIDTLSFDFLYPKDQDPQAKPEDGVFTYGVFFEACKWDWDNWEITESDPKVLYVQAPLIHLLPCKKSEQREFPKYDCPCYKISTRKGVLSTTGHSTNFVMYIFVNSSMDQSHWIKRGCAMLTSLDT